MNHVTINNQARGIAPGFLKSGWFWSAMRWSAFAVMAGMIAAAWGKRGIEDVGIDDPLMYTNLGNLTFWVLWLMGLVILAPLIGRAWCSVCPVGALNEFAGRFGMKKLFPRIMRNQYPRVLALLATVFLMGIYRIHHYPDATALYMAAWIALAVLLGAFFTGRSLCAYLCPVGGMLGLYSRAAPVECGVREETVCRECEDRECVRGAVSWFTMGVGRLKASVRLRKNPCPVNLRVWEMDGTDRCLLCFNCMRACPLDNVAVFKRNPFSSLWDESFPRFSDTVFLAALMGFVLLTFSRFWPASQEVMSIPAAWLGGGSSSLARPVLLIWVGLGLPLAAIVLSGVTAVWSRSVGKVDNPVPDEAAGKGPPIKVWFEDGPSEDKGDPSEEEKVMDKGTVRGLSSIYTPLMIPFVLSAHLVLALVKINTKLAYMPMALADPGGVRSYMAVWELDLIKPPGMLLSIGTVKVLAMFLMLTGTAASLVTYRKIAKREGRGSWPMLLPLLLLGVVVYGGLYSWLF